MKFEGIELDQRYLLKHIVDRGGFGAVYEGIDKKFNSKVAIKLLYGVDLDSKSFRREALLAREFRHPNVVEVFDFGIDTDECLAYIVMEFLEGLRCDQVFQEAEFDPGTFCRFVDQVGSALTSAHQRKLVHRDLKPQNVMLIDQGSSIERFMLLDLGVATKMDSAATLRNQSLDGSMSPKYASPEQVKGEFVGPASDVYSLGVILFEWIAEQHPHQTDNLPQLINSICNTEPVRPSDVARYDVPNEVDTVIFRALAKEPEDRPESIEEIRSTILSAMQDTSSTRPDPKPVEADNVVHSDATWRPNAITSTNMATTRVLADDSKPKWRDDTAKKTISFAWIGGAVLGAVLTCGAIAWWMLPDGSPVKPNDTTEEIATSDQTKISVPDTVTILAPNTLSVQSGQHTDLEVEIEAANPDSVQMQLSALPQWIQRVPVVRTPTGFRYRLRADDRLAAAAPADVELIATIDEKTVSQHKLTLKLITPKLYVPSGYQVESEDRVAWPSRNLQLAASISRTVSDIKVPFVLIPESAHTQPFYIMRDMVWNELLLEYSQQPGCELQPTTDKTGWQTGAIAGRSRLGVVDRPRHPVVNLTAGEALIMVRWLGGQGATLPTTRQWEFAAGFGQKLNGTLDNKWSEGPYKSGTGHREVAIGLRQFGPRPVGSSIDDIGPFGCRDMSGNGEEFTRNIDGSGDFLTETTGTGIFVLTRSRSYQSASPLKWDDLETYRKLPQGLPAGTRSPIVGFRAVLAVEIE